MIAKRYLPFALALGLQGSLLAAGPLAPPGDFQAFDTPDDAGGSITLTWKKMPYEGPDVEYVLTVRPVLEGKPPTESYAFLKEVRLSSAGNLASGKGLPFWAASLASDGHQYVLADLPSMFKDHKELTLSPGTPYQIALTAVERGAPLSTGTPTKAVEAIPCGNLFNWKKLNNLVYVLLFSGIILGFISHAKKRDLFLRRIPGISAIEEAIGRATEMGRPIYYLTGRLGMGSVSTIAAATILGEIVKKVAHYDSEIKVPHTDPIVLGVCQEITKQAYTEAGRPDAYREESNFFVTEEQFSYTAAVDGMMVREKPAACFFMGYYYAESLLLTETGASTGAIQIAGTDAEHQLPFFVTTCDYTLIGEELYAASAYISRQPVLVGTLRGQDVGKAAFMIFLLVACAMVTLFAILDQQGEMQPLLDLFKAF